MDPVPSFRPQDHEFKIYDRKMIVVFAHLTYINVDNFTGHRDLTTFLEYFRVVKTRFAGDEPSTGLVGFLWSH